MNEHLIKYHITPRVLKKGCIQKISIRSLDESYRFYDDIQYNITILSCEDGWEYIPGKEFLHGGRILRQTISAECNDGVISFEYRYDIEGEWKITVAPSCDKHIEDRFNRLGWAWHPDKYLAGIEFAVYVVGEDLFSKRPFKGDLHVHSSGSDGTASPALTAAQYRKNGYDFMAVTDHYDMRPTYKAVNAFDGIRTSFKIFPGEEVHPLPGGIFHVVNFDGKGSVNDIALENPDRTRAEVEKIAETIDIEDEICKKEVAWFSWINQKIHEMGGITIFPHPHWVMNGAYVVHRSTTEELFARKLFDAFEFYGGDGAKRNRLNAQLYYKYFNNTHQMPIVGSSDCHDTLCNNHEFDKRWTITFAKSQDDIRNNILEGNSVVVDAFDSEKNIYGDLRLVRYAWFLIENYYSIHDTLCDASGQALVRYALGDKSQAALIELLEAEVDKYNDNFFGC